MRNLIKNCKIHGKVKHRFINDKRKNKSSYYSCAKCIDNNSKKYRKNHWFKYLAQKANSRKGRCLEKITEEMLLKQFEKQEQKCALTGMKLDVNSKWWKPSLDRIDNNVGYCQSNIRIVAWIVNHSKLDLTDNEFINMCNRVASYYTKYPYVETCLLNFED